MHNKISEADKDIIINNMLSSNKLFIWKLDILSDDRLKDFEKILFLRLLDFDYNWILITFDNKELSVLLWVSENKIKNSLKWLSKLWFIDRKFNEMYCPYKYCYLWRERIIRIIEDKNDK